MEKKRKIKNLEKILGEPFKIKGDEYIFFCPSPKHKKLKPKLSVNLETDKFNCWSCSFKGRTLSRIFSLSDDEKILEEYESGFISSEIEDLRDKKVVLPEEFEPLFLDRSFHGSKYKEYLFKRGFDEVSIARYKIGYAKSGRYSGRVIFPSFDKYGEVNFFVARSIFDVAPKYLIPVADRNKVIFNEYMIEWDKTVVLVEGAFDSTVYENSVPVLGNTLSKNSALFQKLVLEKSNVIVALDDDAWGNTIKLAKNLRSYCLDVKIARLSGHDPMELGKENFGICIEQSRYLTTKDLIDENCSRF